MVKTHKVPIRQSGHAAIAVVLIIVLFAVICIGLFVYNKSGNNHNTWYGKAPVQKDVEISNTDINKDIVLSVSSTDTADMATKRFVSSDMKLEFNYPTSWGDPSANQKIIEHLTSGKLIEITFRNMRLVKVIALSSDYFYDAQRDFSRCSYDTIRESDSLFDQKVSSAYGDPEKPYELAIDRTILVSNNGIIRESLDSGNSYCLEMLKKTNSAVYPHILIATIFDNNIGDSSVEQSVKSHKNSNEYFVKQLPYNGMVQIFETIKSL